MKKRSLLVLVILLLAACQPAATASPTTLSALAKTLPAASDTPQPATPAPTEATLAAGSTVAAQPSPSATPFQPATPTPASLGPQAFSDCALLPGLPSCKGLALPLSGLLAVNDAANGRLALANFKDGSAWQMPFSKLFTSNPSGSPAGLSFSPSGTLLGVYPPGNSGVPFTVLEASNGQVKQQLPVAGLPEWTPKDTLDMAPFRTAWSPAGDEAWIDYQKAVLHVRFAAHPDQEVTWPVEPAPSDRIHQVIAWAPGSDTLLAEYHFGSNSMWVTGGELYTINAKSGKVVDLKAHMKLDFQFQWHPGEAGVFVLGESSNSPVMGGQRLAVLNALTGELKYLIADRNVSVSSPQWLSDGKTVLFAARYPDTTPSGSPFATSSIYVIGRDGKGAAAITRPPAGRGDDAPQLLPDGQNFLYFRVDEAAKTAVLRVASLDGKLDQPVTGPLLAPACFTTCAWNTAALYRP